MSTMKSEGFFSHCACIFYIMPWCAKELHFYTVSKMLILYKLFKTLKIDTFTSHVKCKWMRGFSGFKAHLCFLLRLSCGSNKLCNHTCRM